MIVLPPSLESEVCIIDDVARDTIFRKFIPLAKKDNKDEIKVSGYTSIFLQDLSEVSLENLGEDPLSKFDTYVVLISGDIPRVYCDPQANIISISESFLNSLEFSAAHAALTNLLRKLKNYFVKNGGDEHNLVENIDGARNAIYGLMQARLLLHAVGEEELPNIAALLPDVYWSFIHRQMVLCLIFVLLHEQAHIEFHKTGNVDVENIPIEKRIIIESITDSKEEEYAADVWAIDQVGDESKIKVVKAGLFFLLNYWAVNYVTHSDVGSHPANFNRANILANRFPQFKDNDPEFFNIVNSELSKQQRFLHALEKQSKGNRYVSMIQYCRKLGEFSQLEEMVSAVSKTFKEKFYPEEKTA